MDGEMAVRFRIGGVRDGVALFFLLLLFATVDLGLLCACAMSMFM